MTAEEVLAEVRLRIALKGVSATARDLRVHRDSVRGVARGVATREGTIVLLEARIAEARAREASEGLRMDGGGK